MSAYLASAIEAQEIVKALKPYGLTQDRIAKVVNVSPRAIRHWGNSGPRPVNYDRLAALRDLVNLLSDSLSPRGVGQWLLAANRSLEGARPIEVLASGDFDAVTHAAQSFIDGAYL
jgi:hypothetical protein